MYFLIRILYNCLVNTMALVLQMKQLIAEISSLNFISSCRTVTSLELRFKRFGNPLNVVEMVECSLPPLGKTDVLVRMLAAPVNPADINIIQGKYPIKPKLPKVAGNEGVGIVEEVGKDVIRICAGQKVIVAKPGQGTWRNLAVFNQNHLRIIPFHLGLAESATLSVNPCTAYRLLTDYIPVRENNNLVVIQNGANSAVGQNIIQLCKVWGIQNVNVVRNRTDIKELKDYLCCLGATFVLTEEELPSTKIFAHRDISRPCLALNCVGGNNCLKIMKHMNHSGVVVTYGGMSKKPVKIPTPALIFKNLSCFGFWLTAWEAKAKEHDKDKMITELINLMCERRLRAPVHKLVHFERYKEAIGNTLTTKGFSGCKYIMDFSCTI